MNSKKLAIFGGTIVFVVVALIYLLSQKQNLEPSKDSDYAEFISAYTSGTISREASIKIRLTQAINKDKQKKILTSLDYLKIEPKINGELYWLDKQTIEFTPKEKLKPDTKYVVKFDIGKIVNTKQIEKPFVFEFKTIKRQFDVKVIGLKSLSSRNTMYQKLLGKVETADFEDIGDVKKILTANLDGEKLPIEWYPGQSRKVHKFLIDSLKRTDKERKIKLFWDGNPMGIDNKGQKEVIIPALGEFNLTSVNVAHQPQQYLLLRFTDPIKQNQNLHGLITIEKVPNLRFEVSGNEIKVYPSKRLFGDYKIHIFSGIRNSMNYKMKKDYTRNVAFENLKPAVRLVGKGVIVPNNKDGFILPFEAVNLSAVDVIVTKIFENNMSQFLQVNNIEGASELRRVGKPVLRKVVKLDQNGIESLHKWNRYSLDLSEIMQKDPGAVYRVQIGFRKKYSLYFCGKDINDKSKESLTTLQPEDEESESSYWDFYDNYYNYDYNWRHRDDPCYNAYYGNRRSVAKNIFSSDIGIMAKRGNDGSILLITTSIKTAQPMSNVILHVLDFQQQEIVKLTTDNNGMAESKLNVKPFMVLAEKGKEKGYLRLDDGSSLSISKFDVAGSGVKKGIKGFIYGDRGVWRPGDSLFVTFILNDPKKNVPLNLPIIFELTNPKNQLIHRFVKRRNKSDFYTFKFKTDLNAQTGDWNANITVGAVKFNKSLKIETVKPNRLKIKFDLKEPYLSAKTNPSVKMKISWLTGAVAKNLKAKVDVSLSRTRTTFKTYSNYSFDDPVIKFTSKPQTIFDGKVDSKGEVTFNVNLNLDEVAPGKLKANFFTKAFEPGGDFSIDRFSTDYYPYDTYVGIKLPKGDKARGMLLTDKNHKVEIVTLNLKGQPVSKKKIEVKLYKISWKWWWDQSEEYESNYSGNYIQTTLASDTISTINGEGNWNIKVKYPDWGRFLVTAKDLEGGHRTGKIVYIDWPGWAGKARKAQPGGSAMLSFSSDKKKYFVGDDIELMIPSSDVGRALVSIESGTKVIDSYWVEMKSGMNKFKFKATQEMTPNVYANVTLLQPYEHSSNDLPIRLYGIIPIYVENPETHLSPEINMPNVLRPEKSFKLTVKEKHNKPMTYTIAIVDEGLLDLTRFKTPNPWKHFYGKEALGVRTWDIYDLVIGAYGGKLEHLLGLGGDGEIRKPKGGTKLNRFKPMVRFLGPFTLKRGEKHHIINVPRYVGSVRTMVIAGYGNSFGFVEKATPVRKPLMILGTLPRVLSPGETVELPVSVFAMEKGINDVSVHVKSNKLFNVLGNGTKSVHFNSVGDKLVKFRIKVNPTVGIGMVSIFAESGSQKAQYDIKLEVRNPNPYVVDVASSVIDSKKEWTQNIKPFGIKGTNNCVLEVSTIPPLNLESRLKYLIRYPHGCIEQTTSSVFPQLYLDWLVHLDNEQKESIDDNIKKGIERIKKFQIGNGGLSYWPGEHKASEWGTNYGGHFMVEAYNKGYSLPSGFLIKWKNYQRNAARNWNSKANRSDLIQAYRLYTLALSGSPELGSMNRLLEYKDLSKPAKYRLAAAYELTGKHEVAEKLLAGLDFHIKKYTELANTYGSSLRDQAMILETLTLVNRKDEGFRLLKAISERISSSNWYSTQTTAYVLLSVAKFIGKDKNITHEVNFSYSLNGGNKKVVVSNNPIAQENIDVKYNTNESITVFNPNNSPIYARIILEGKPLTGDQSDASNKLSMEVKYYLMDGKKIDPVKLEQGTDFIAEVKVTNTGLQNKKYKQMVLTEIFPSGWEIINTRLNNIESFDRASEPEYKDIRDDRVYFYYSLNRKETKTFRVLLNASYLGKFYLPSVYSQAMYDNTINARRHGRWVEVVLPGE